MKNGHRSVPAKLLVAGLVACIGFAAESVHAQDKKPGSVFGKVTDIGGKPAPNLIIKLSRITVAKVGGGKGGAKGSKSIFDVPDFRQLMFQTVVATTKTDAAGAYEFKILQPGTHIYNAGDPQAAIGYKSGAFKVISDQRIELNIQLESQGSESPGQQGQ